MASSSSAPSGSSKSPRSPADRMSGRPEAAWSTSSNYSRTSSTRTERSLDDEDEDGYDRNLAYGNTQAIAGPSASPYDPRQPRPTASPLAPAPGDTARWQASPSHAMAPYAYDNRIQSAPIVGQNQALYQNTYAPAPHVTNRDTGNTNTSQVTDAYNNKSYNRVEVTNMTIHNHYHTPQSAPPTSPSSPPISAGHEKLNIFVSVEEIYYNTVSYPREPSDSASAPCKRPLNFSVVYYDPLIEALDQIIISSSLQDRKALLFPNHWEGQDQVVVVNGEKILCSHQDLMVIVRSGRPQLSLISKAGRALSDIVRPERSQAQDNRNESVDILDSELKDLSFGKGKDKQGRGSDLKSSGSRMNIPISSASTKAKRTTDRQEEIEFSGPPPPPPKDTEFIEGRQTSATSRSKEVALSPVDASVPTTPLGDPIGTWILHSGIEDHIPVYMGLRLLSTDKKTIPLWHPQPSPNRQSGRKRGTEVGDIVYLSDSGKIHVLFNIFRSFKENRDDGAYPPPEHYYRHIDTELLDEKPFQEKLQDRKCYFTKNIAKKGAKHEGIIILPRGGVKASIPRGFFADDQVKEFFCRYSPLWYHHVRATRPRIRNGDLFLVTQSHNAKTFGIAALALKKPAKESLSIEFGYDGKSSTYHWESRDCWWMSSVSMPVSQDEDIHHCLGVTLYSLLLDEKTWTTHFDDTSSPITGAQSPTSPSQISSADLSTRKSDSSPGGRGSTFSKLSPRFWGGRKSDKQSGNEETTGSIQQSIPEGHFLSAGPKIIYLMFDSTPNTMDSGISIEGLPALDYDICLDAVNASIEDFGYSWSAAETEQAGILQQVSSWIEDPCRTKPILWICGGTSIERRFISQTVSDTCRSSQQFGASFFFRKGRVEGFQLFPTIAHQLSSNIPELGEIMKAAAESSPSTSSDTIAAQFHSLFLRPLQSLARPSSSSHIIIIDGLDECENPSNAQQVILECIGESVSRRLPFRFIISSSSQSGISQAFNAENLRKTTLQLLLPSPRADSLPSEIQDSPVTKQPQSPPSNLTGRRSLQLPSYPRIVALQQRNGYQESFCRSLLLAGHGFPIWRPSGNLAMPIEYRMEGVNIGDVGIIDEGGSFKFYFNIFLPSGHPIHKRIVPREFRPIEPALQPDEVVRDLNYFEPGKIIASKGVVITRHSETPLKLHFTSTEPDGGIIVLPNGASREDLVSTDRFREYARQNAPHWYQYINHYGRTLHANGSLFLVTGCDKANDWAIASFPFHPGRSEDSLDLHYAWRPDFECPWFDPGTAEAKYYCPPEPLPKACSANNQCIFIRGMRISLSQQSWRKTLPFDDGAKLHYSLILDTPSKFQRRLNSILCFLRLRLPEERAVDIVTNKDPHLFHPNYVISQVLSAAHPDAELALLDDTAWCSLVNNASTFQEPSSLPHSNLR
ncbi:hypothetical protein CVT26_002647 [Gymnopilus dilepis]|uniref:Nephrocystin 3-like N-terminal domain-containing protein n=1 Tax=Gymnopilus dilepis TaxID=231916 RepID=A0A409VE71_9AGAR|nr:hypothetical protein CVT26_002647 [Gymnopilus dilepis]